MRWYLQMMSMLDAWRRWRETRSVLRQVGRANRDQEEVRKFQVETDLTYAQAAIDRDDPADAFQIWERLCRTYPVQTGASQQSVNVLIGLHRFDEAEDLMLRGQRRKPGDPFYAIGLLRVIHHRRDWARLIETAEKMRRRFPGAYETYSLAAFALRAVGRFDEADKISLEATRRFPEELHALLEYCQVATDRGDWVEAKSRWDLVLAKYPAFSNGPVGLSQALIKLQQYDEADAVLNAARLRFGTEPKVPCELAKCAEARGDNPEAIRRWKIYVQRFPLYRHAYYEAAAALERLGDPEEAERVLREAVERFEDEPKPLIDLGSVLLRNRSFQAAADAFAQLREAFPACEPGYIHGASALQALGRPEEAASLLREHAKCFPKSKVA